MAPDQSLVRIIHWYHVGGAVNGCLVSIFHGLIEGLHGRWELLIGFACELSDPFQLEELVFMVLLHLELEDHPGVRLRKRGTSNLF